MPLKPFANLCIISGNSNDWKTMFDTNVMGLNICTREAVKIMEETKIKAGHIININRYNIILFRDEDNIILRLC